MRLRGYGPLIALALQAPCAWGYTIETPLTHGCHERITESAVCHARAITTAAAPLALATGDDRAMAADLPFSVDDDMGDLAALSMLLGVRDNDLKGLLPTDFAGLAIVQGDPNTQTEHCLRSYADNEPDGTPNALAQCRSYILDRVHAALNYLTPEGLPDPSARLDRCA